MMVGMVDTSSLAGVLRASQRPKPPTPKTSRLEDMFSGYLRNQQIGAEETAKGTGSGIADFAVRRGVSDSPGLRAGALAGDILLDPANLIGIPAVGAAAKTGARVAQLAPDTRQLYLNSLLGRLYHGNRGDIKGVGGPPSVLSNRGPQPGNWFQADTFLTTSKPLARSYAWDGLYKARVPLDVAENMNVLNLYGNPEEHLRLANSPRVLDYLSDMGANVVRHQSGHGAGAGVPPTRAVTNPFTLKGKLVPGKKIEAPVYAFLEPAGIQMSRVNDFTGNLRKNMVGAHYAARQKLQSLLERITKTGEFDPDNVL